MDNEPMESSFLSTSRSGEQPRTPQKSTEPSRSMGLSEGILTPIKLRSPLRNLQACKTRGEVTKFEERGKTIIQKKILETTPEHRKDGLIVASEARFYDEEEFAIDTPLLKWCPFCSRETVTVTEYKNSPKTFWSAVGIFFMGGVLGCFMLPYMTTSCKEIHFVCSICKHSL